ALGREGDGETRREGSIDAGLRLRSGGFNLRGGVGSDAGSGVPDGGKRATSWEGEDASRAGGTEKGVGKVSGTGCVPCCGSSGGGRLSGMEQGALDAFENHWVLPSRWIRRPTESEAGMGDMDPETDEVEERQLRRDEWEWELRASDSMYLRVPNVLMGFKFASLLDVQHLVKGLELTLERFPIMAGGVVRDPKSKRYKVVMEGSKGVCLQVRSSSLPPPEHAEDPSVLSWDKFFPPEADGGFKEPSQRAALRASVTLFPEYNTSIICLGFVHCVTDGEALVNVLHTWSYLTSQIAGVEPRPAKLPKLPILDRRIDFPHELLSSIKRNRSKELERKIPTWEIFKVVKALVTDLPKSEICDFRLNNEDLKEFKNMVSAELPEGKWVSSYEVIMAILLRLRAAADRKSLKPSKIKFRTLVNSRGRGEFSPPGYFGNALAYVPITIPLSCQTDPERWVGDTALFLHEKLRAKLKDGAMLDRIHGVFEDALLNQGMNDGLLSRASFNRPWALALLGSPITNSWASYPMLDINFGSPEPAMLMRVPRGFTWLNHLFMCPRTKDEMFIRVHVRPGRGKYLRRFISELGLPLHALLDEPQKLRRPFSLAPSSSRSFPGGDVEFVNADDADDAGHPKAQLADTPVA
ncbi:Uncharacterized protein SCF082_LOCUS26985, partial [Durusdinium trenchii]